MVIVGGSGPDSGQMVTGSRIRPGRDRRTSIFADGSGGNRLCCLNVGHFDGRASDQRSADQRAY